MPKNSIEDLRDHLFATIESLRDEEKPMDVERAKAISAVAQTIIASAAVEVKMIEATGADESASNLFRKRTTTPALTSGMKQ